MQLHELVDAVTADEPPMARTADDIVAAGRRAERRRRAGLASAGAAGLVAVVAAGAVVLPSFGSRHDTTVPPAPIGAAPATGGEQWADAPPFTFTFQAFDAGRFQVQNPIVVSTAYQIAPVYLDGHTTNDKPVTPEEAAQQSGAKRKGEKAADEKPTIFAYLTVYRPGAFDPAGIKDGEVVTVAGRRAVQATLPFGRDPRQAITRSNKELAWEYTDNAWATVTSISGSADDPSFAELGALVTGLKPVTPRPAVLPFTVGYLPSGYQPVQTGTHAMPGLDGIAAARAGDYGGATYASPPPATTGLNAPFDSGGNGIPRSFTIGVAPSRNSNQAARAGRTTCYPGGFCNVWSADGKVQVQVSNQGTGADLPASELTRIASSIKVADVGNEATWTPAAEALQP